MARRRTETRNWLSYLPLNGCILFFEVNEYVVRAACSGMDSIVEAHKINGTFLNKSGETNYVDMYVCLRGNLDES